MSGYITPERLVSFASHVSRALADQLAGALETAMPNFGVTSLLSRAHFMAQAAHESAGFTRFEENLHYTHPETIAATFHRLADRAEDLCNKPQALANAAYALRNGNGDEASGDGWRYRGRGLFQLTGRANYAAAGKALGLDCLAQPDEIAAPHGAVLSALWFFQSRGCIDAANADDAEAVTRLINGPGLNGLPRRIELTELAKRDFA